MRRHSRARGSSIQGHDRAFAGRAKTSCTRSSSGIVATCGLQPLPIGAGQVPTTPLGARFSASSDHGTRAFVRPASARVVKGKRGTGGTASDVGSPDALLRMNRAILGAVRCATQEKIADEIRP